MIQEFLEYQCNVKGLAAQTLQGYEKELRQWTAWARPQGLRWSNISKQDIDRWTADQGKRGLKPRTIRRRVEVLRLLFTWAEHEGLLTSNPARFCQTPKAAKTLPAVADTEKVFEYIDSTPSTGQGVIVRTMAAIFIETGIRIGELQELRLSDIDIDARTMSIHGKGAKERVVFFGKRTEKLLRRWYIGRGEQLFPGEQRYYRQAMAEEMSSHCGRMHPHLLRHTFATMQLNNGMPLKEVGHLLGHEHVTTTEIYAHVATAHAHELYNKVNQLTND